MEKYQDWLLTPHEVCQHMLSTANKRVKDQVYESIDGNLEKRSKWIEKCEKDRREREEKKALKEKIEALDKEMEEDQDSEESEDEDDQNRLQVDDKVDGLL